MTIQDIQNLSTVEIVGLTIDGEAESEPILGQVAVANVIKNRLGSYGRSYREVCFFNDAFSCWLPGMDRDRLFSYAQSMLSSMTVNSIPFQHCLYLASLLLADCLIDITGGMNHYLKEEEYRISPPSWALNVPVKHFGSQVFLKVA